MNIKKSEQELSTHKATDLNSLSYDSDLSDVGLCSLNTQELTYNEIISLLFVL